MAFVKKYFGDNIRETQTTYMVIIILLIALSLEGFSFIYWTNFFSKVTYIIFLLIVFLTLKNTSFLKIGNFSYHVLLLWVIPFFSIVNRDLIYESFGMGIVHIFRISSIWFIYYLLHIHNVRESTILKALLCISIFIAFAQIIQQFTYPNVLFGVSSEEKLSQGLGRSNISIRNGLYRFRITIYYSIPILMLLLVYLKEKINIKLLVLFILLSISVYLSLTRQYIFSFLFVSIFGLFANRTIKFAGIILSLLLCVVIYTYADSLFSYLVDKTKDEATEDNIRVLAASFFWNETIKTPLTFLFGYGPCDNYETMLANNRHFYISDVGFIGAMWRHGFIYVALTYHLLYLLFIKYKKEIPLYIRLFVLFAAIISVMIFPFELTKIIIWPFLLYICDLHINKSPLALQYRKI